MPSTRSGRRSSPESRDEGRPSRRRTPTILFGTEGPILQEPKPRRRRRKQTQSTTRPPLSTWAAYEKRMDGHIAKARAARFFVETYARDYEEAWSGKGMKIRPEKTILEARAKLKDAKRSLVAIAREIEALNSKAFWGQDDDDASIDVEHVGCSVCGKYESDATNDIVLCDRVGCFRAFHVKCCDPELDAEQLGDPDDDWFCHQCNCLQRCVEKIDEAFDKAYANDPSRWTTLFDSDDDDDDDLNGQRSGAATAPPNTILALDLDSDDDSDFDEADDDARRASRDDEEDDDEDEDDDEESAASGDDPVELGRDALPKAIVVEDVNEKNILDGPRKRAKVDYVALNEAFFADYEDSEDEEDDDAAYRSS